MVIEVISFGTHQVNPSWYHQAFSANCFPFIKIIFYVTALVAAISFIAYGIAKLLKDYVFIIEEERVQIIETSY